MPSLNALIGQPQGGGSPPAQTGSSGSAETSPLQGAIQQGGPQGQGGPPPAPDHKTTVAAIRHINAFDQRWRALLADPGIGTKSIRPKVYEVMADLMGDGYCTLPQSLTLLKSFPTDPLEQKQWLEKHVAQDEKAIEVLLDHHAAAFPRNGDEPVPPDPGDLGDDHLQSMDALAQGFSRRQPPKPITLERANGIPMRK